MIVYFTQVTIIWVLSFILYFLLLKKETYFRLNRLFLLFTIMIGIVLPMFPWEIFFSASPQSNFQQQYIHPIIITADSFDQQIIISSELSNAGFFHWKQLLIWGYWVVCLYFFVRLSMGLIQLLRMIRMGQIYPKIEYTLVNQPNIEHPFSFFKYMFLPNNIEENSHLENLIILHELAHIKGWHSLDRMLVEIVKCFFWWNPLSWWFGKEIELNHEFIADARVIQKIDKKDYGHMLIGQSISGSRIALSNHFSLHLKQRFKMMKKERSRPIGFVKYILAVPLLVLFITLFAKSSYIGMADNAPTQVAFNDDNSEFLDTIKPNPKQAGFELDKNSKIEQYLTNGNSPFGKIYAEVDQMPLFRGCENIPEDQRKACSDNRLMTYINNNIKYPREARERGIQGLVWVKFIVDKQGGIGLAEISKGIGAGCDKEVLRVVQSIPTLSPGILNEAPVNSVITLPVEFVIRKNQAPKEVTDIFKVVEKMPLFGAKCLEDETSDEKKRACAQKEMMEFIYQNIQYPKLAKDNGIQGTVVVGFVVEKDGSLSNIDIKRRIGGGCDEVVIKLIEQMPNWIPGTQRGHLVRTQIMLPVTFKLRADEIKEQPVLPKQEKRELVLENFRIAPNPTRDVFNIQFTAPSGTFELVFYNMEGQIIEKHLEDAADGLYSKDFDLNQLPNGTYFIGILKDESVFTRKIVKQK